MSHLKDAEFVDLIDGCLAEARRRHVDGCAACGDRARALREVLARTAEADVPEPSPLFWDQLSSRVRQDIEAADVPTPARRPAWTGWTRHPARVWAVPAVLAILAAATLFWWNPRQPANDLTGIAAADPGASPPLQAAERVVPDPDIEADDAWALVRAAADGLAWEDAPAAGITAWPGAADHIALEMSSDERTALAQLIADEMRPPGA